jgi:hypothetical protein
VVVDERDRLIDVGGGARDVGFRRRERAVASAKSTNA